MKTKIGLMGSCVSRDIFRSIFNDYKKYFEITFTLQRISLISLLASNIDFNNNEIMITPLNKENNFRSEILREDLSKDYLKIIGNNIDYLIIDEFFEVYFGIIKFDSSYITNNFWDYPATKFYDKVNTKNKLTLEENFNEYFALWKNNVDNFFHYLNFNFPNVKVILNKVRLVSKVLKEDGTYYSDKEFQKKVEKYNPLLNILEDYLETFHDVIVIDCTENLVADENHIWGKGIVHYNNEFYINSFKKILEIIK